MANIKDKIKKLLALAKSPNEFEARDALLKARELMAENKMTELDFEEKEEVKVVTVEADVKWTTDSGNIWMADLAKVVGDRYCCATAWYTPQGTRTHILYITGVSDDVQVCKEVMEYAVGFVLGQIKVMARKRRGDEKAIGKSYAKGFVMGLELAFEQQEEEHKEWGLVVQKPQEVLDYENSLSSKSVKTKKADLDPLAFLKGKNDGSEFTGKKVIKG